MAESTITEERMDRYLDTTRRAFDKVTIIAPKRSFANKMALNFMEMATSYYQDAVHNRKAGDFVLAYAQVNYAHGWLDAGARLGVFEVEEDDQLFTLLE